MLGLLNSMQLFFDSPESGSGSGEMSKEDMIDFISEEENEDVIELDKSKKLKTESTESESIEEESDNESEDEIESGDELEELEKELTEPSEDQLELVTPVRRKEILAKYPKLFKDFPYLEKAYYREQQFTELFPTIDDAKISASKGEILDKFEQDVIGDGNIINILKAVKEENPNSFNKMVDNYFNSLAEVDEKAYHHVLGNIVKNTIVSMVRESDRSKNDALKAAAQILNQFVFGTSDFVPPTQLSKGRENNEENKQINEIQKQKQQFVRQAFETTLTDLNTKVNNTLRNTVQSHIDPKQSMSEYIRRNAVRDCMESLESLVGKDLRFKSLTDKLWDKAVQSNFSKESVERIKSAYLSKAKTLLPSVIKKARNDALRGMGKRVKDSDESESDDKSPDKSELSKLGRPRSTSSNSGKITNPKEIPKGMSTMDFLMRD